MSGVILSRVHPRRRISSKIRLRSFTAFRMTPNGSIFMSLIELTSADKESYNRFVAQCASGSFLQSWGWGEWQIHLGRTVCRLQILDDNGKPAASIQLIKMLLPLGSYYLYAPYGPVFVGGENFQFSIFNFQLFLQELQRKFPDAVFIRLEPKDAELLTTHYPLLTKSHNIQPGKTLLVDLTKPEEQLLAEMHSKTRYNIKVAQKHGVVIKDEFDISVGHGLFFEETLKLIIGTSRRQKFMTFPVGYYKKMVDFFALNHKSSALAEENYSGQSADLSAVVSAEGEALAKADGIGNSGEVKLHIYKAILSNQLLAAAIMMDFGKTRTFLFGGSSENNKNVMAPYLLHWQAIKDAQAQGFEAYDFWGTETSSGEVPGFVRFKLGFGGKERQYAGAYDFVINKPRYRVYRFLRAVNKMAKKISLG